MNIGNFQNFIRTLGEKAGLVGLEADQEGYIGLTFGDLDAHIQFDEETGMVVLFSRLGEMEADRTEDIARMLLGANLFWQGTKGATFSIEPSTGRVFLADRQRLDTLSPADAIGWIEAFHAIAIHWRSVLDGANRGDGIPLGGDGAADEPDEARDTDYAESFIRA